MRAAAGSSTWNFWKWSDDLASATRTVTFDANRSLQALFRYVQTGLPNNGGPEPALEHDSSTTSLIRRYRAQRKAPA